MREDKVLTSRPRTATAAAEQVVPAGTEWLAEGFRAVSRGFEQRDATLAVVVKQLNAALDNLMTEIRVLNRRLELVEERRGTIRKQIERDERGDLVAIVETED